VRLGRLAEVGLSGGRLTFDEAAEQACAMLGELLGLDAAWLVAGTAFDLGPRASWSRPGLAAARLGDNRLSRLAEEALDGASQTRDGRYTVVTVRLSNGAGTRVFLMGAVRSTQPLSEPDLAYAGLIGAVYGPSLADTLPAEPRRESDALSSPMILQALAAALAGARSEADVARAVVDGLRGLIESHSCRFYLLAPSGDRLVAVAHSSGDPAGEQFSVESLECAIGEGVAGSVFASGVPRRVPNARRDPTAVAIEGTDLVDESMLAAPMQIDGDPIGVIVLTRLGVDRFDEDDLSILEVVASTAAVGCRSARLNERAQEQADVAEALLHLGEALAVQATADDISQMVARAVDQLVDSAALAVWLREGDDLRLAGHIGYTPAQVEWLHAQRRKASDPAYAEQLGRRRLTVVEAGRDGPLADIPAGSTLVIVPIGESAGNRGAIVLRRGPRRGAPSSRDEQMLLGIADQALLALTNRELYRELDEAFLATVKALANALETKDEYTEAHAQALVGLSSDLARRLGMRSGEVRDVSLAAALHDIGKIGVPVTILNKPGPLTEEEWEVMRMHPEWGARIIEPVPALAGARDLVIACHEHFDGSGYPLGLGGEEIPLGARIILACDAYHAMTSDRVYRKALGRDAALAEIRRCAGSHFDPRVAEALIEIVESTTG
jgi:HD-GYP domain-containing protein (c-di-GMP phosphodiesterase class II)